MYDPLCTCMNDFPWKCISSPYASSNELAISIYSADLHSTNMSVYFLILFKYLQK